MVLVSVSLLFLPSVSTSCCEVKLALLQGGGGGGGKVGGMKVDLADDEGVWGRDGELSLKRGGADEGEGNAS
jgi:hypothetical protein